LKRPRLDIQLQISHMYIYFHNSLSWGYCVDVFRVASKADGTKVAIRKGSESSAESSCSSYGCDQLVRRIYWITARSETPATAGGPRHSLQRRSRSTPALCLPVLVATVDTPTASSVIPAGWHELNRLDLSFTAARNGIPP
jgi:hypothetical protein